ncbi:MAG: Nif3-like dinuclear metal center hexameric protein [Armatimonadota bacterium]
MPTVGDLLAALEQIAPRSLALPGDPGGLQVGSRSGLLSGVLVALDCTGALVEQAASEGAQAVVVHHPPIYRPLGTLVGDEHPLPALRAAVQRGVAVIAAHTNWDAAEGGVNDSLAARLHLHAISPFGEDSLARLYKLVTFLPMESADAIFDALAEAGCGQIGLYRRCAFLSPGVGTFEPQAGAQPTIGEVGRRETVEEVRVEMVVPESAKERALRALREHHPYDEPAFDLYELANGEAVSIGRAGLLPEALPARELRLFVDAALGSRSRLFGPLDGNVSRVAVVGGSGGRYWSNAMCAGCDALVTGEVRHHEAVAAAEAGFVLVEAGHFHTEQPGMESLASRLTALMPDVRFGLVTPHDGFAGNPA